MARWLFSALLVASVFLGVAAVETPKALDVDGSVYSH
jgi:hypothetical protein